MLNNILTHYAQTIVENTQGIINYGVIITDDDGVIIGAIDKARLGKLHASSFSVIKNGLPEVLYEDEAKAMGVLAGICLPIRLGREMMGTVAIAGQPNEVDKYGHLVQKEVELFLREKSLNDISRLRESAINNLMHQIINLDTQNIDASVVIAYAKSMGYNLSSKKIILLVDINHFTKIVSSVHEEEKYEHEAELRVQTIKLTLLGILRSIFDSPQDIVTNLASDKYIIMLDLAYYSENQIVGFVHGKAETVIESLEKSGYSATVGVGTVAENLKKLKDSYRGAWRAIVLGDKMKKKCGICDIDSFRMEDLFMSLNANAVEQYVDKTIGCLINSSFWNPDLEMTLRELLRNPFQPGVLAQKLGIHRNSLYYRLAKIEEYSGLDLKDPEDFIRAKVAFTLYDLFKQETDKTA